MDRDGAGNNLPIQIRIQFRIGITIMPIPMRIADPTHIVTHI
jgi:hypothetical protein